MLGMNVVGQLHSFDENADDIIVFCERLEQYFIANSIKEDDPRRAALLLTSISGNTYKLLQDICFPNKPSENKYEELTTLLRQHLERKRSIFAERFKFHRASQGESESIQGWSARLKGLAAYCNFGSGLEIALRDRFIVGLRSAELLNRIFKEPETLTYRRALEIALQSEAAKVNVSEITKEGCEKTAGVHRVEEKKHGGPKEYRKPRQNFAASATAQYVGRNTSKKEVRSCYACGDKGHFKADCKYVSYKCKNCKLTGHLAKVCKNSAISTRVNKNYYCDSNSVKDESETNIDIFNLQTGSKEPFMLNVLINNVWINMEIDSGSGVSTMSKEFYDRHFKKLKLSKSNVVLVGYTKTKDRPVGVFKPEIKWDDMLVKCDIHVVANGGPPLLGRDLMGLFNIKPTKINFLKEEQIRASIFEQFPDVFKPGLGTYKYAIASLRLKEGAKPMFVKPRPLPFAFKESVEKELIRLENIGVITKVEHSDWGTPLVPVLKSDGTLRICADYKTTLNKYLEEDKYPLPRIEDLFARLQGGVEFTKLDLSQAYNQVRLDKQSQLLTAWSTHRGVFRVNRLPFGVTPAAAKFQKVLEQLLQGVEGVVNYLDDIVVTGKSREEHVSRLKAVLERIERAGLKLQKDKCFFFMKEIKYLGHVISKEGLSKEIGKVRAILEANAPSSADQVKSFVGMVSYYGRFIPNLAALLRPLYDLLKKDVPFKWTAQCEQAFRSAKEFMGTDVVLAHYDPRLPIKVSCDASSGGIGAVLAHKYPNGTERPIAYVARTLSPAEINYSMIEKEALAIFFAVKRFHQYVYGRRFTLVTDHKPLLAIFGPHRGVPVMAAGRLQRWALFLSGYQYDIEGIKGSKNYGPDYLSRSSNGQVVQNDDDISNYLHFIESARNSPINSKDISRETRRDPMLSRVIECIEHGWPSSVESDMQPFFNRKSELTVEQHCIMWGFRVVVPARLRQELLDELHVSHPGIVKMKSAARSFMWWPSIDKQIEEKVKGCMACTVNRQEPAKAALIPWQQALVPWDRVHIDYLGPFKGKMFLIVIDAFTKWPEAIQVSNANAENTVEKLRELFARFGLPRLIVTDNGTQFTGQLFRDFTTRNGIKHSYTPPAHPATNGLAENGVKQFKTAMYKALSCPKSAGLPLQTLLARFLLNYRNSIHGTTNESPAKLMLGRSLRVRLSQIKPSLTVAVRSSQESQIKHFKGKREISLEIGQGVAVRDYSEVNKKFWLPARVEKQLGPRVYLCRLSDGRLWKRHINQILNNVTAQTISIDTEDPIDELAGKEGELEITDQAGGGIDTGKAVVQQGGELTQTLPVAEPRPKRNVKPPERLDL